MKLQHQTEVQAAPAAVWEFLQDTRAVVQCLPGAELVDELGDDHFQGVLRVAIGPLKMNYAGDAVVVERDAGERRIVLDAGGRDKRGAGAVKAHVRLTVQPSGEASRIDVVSDVDLTGRIASLGRGVRDVSNKIFVDFAGQLAARVEGGHDAPVTAPNQPFASAAVHETADATRTSAPAGIHPTAGADSDVGEIKVLPLVWTVIRERLAYFLERLSNRVRPQ